MLQIADDEPRDTAQAPDFTPPSTAEHKAYKVFEYSVSCINTYSERALSAQTRYLQWVDPQTGPTGHERHIYGVYTLFDNGERCLNGVTEAANVEPSLPDVEQAASNYIKALQTLAPLLVEANRYYERESYRDDAMAAGKALHQPLMTAFKAFAAADEVLRDHLDTLQAEARNEKLARLEGIPTLKTHLLIERVMQQALAVMQSVETFHVVNNLYVGDDNEKFVELAQTLESTIDQLVAHSPEAGESLPDESDLDSFVQAAEDYLEPLSKLRRRVQSNERFSPHDVQARLGQSSEWMLDGSVGQVKRDYNELVDDYNQL